MHVSFHLSLFNVLNISMFVEYRVFSPFFQSHWGDLNAFYWYQIFALVSAVVEAQKYYAHMEDS